VSTLDVRWNVAAERDLLQLPPSDAERIIAAVETFADTGRGFIRVLLDGSGERRLYVEGFYAIVTLDESVLSVLRVHRSS
jgi:hypothetical protein